MKKTYKNPEIEVIKMKMHQHLLDGSQDAHEEIPDEYGGHDTDYEW